MDAAPNEAANVSPMIGTESGSEWGYRVKIDDPSKVIPGVLDHTRGSQPTGGLI